ncbi:MAG: hypothetical protein IAG13_36030 [Deltaproteobacteria bacterium]|nr:hypothetical protein [Nannocystaceae bacterium]
MHDEPRILSAFFGLDDSLPISAATLCKGAAGQDGMPVTFSRRVSVTDVPASAFRVHTAAGETHTPLCATLSPATEDTERHTVLLVGQFGGEPNDPPAEVEVVSDLPLEGGTSALGLTGPVTPLIAGPTLLIGLRFDPADIASDCPAGTKSVVQVTWAGGVSAPGGGDLGELQRIRHRVLLADGGGGAMEVIPTALADLADNDNYVQLCINEGLTPLSVRVEANTVVDPRGDLNPTTTIELVDGP